MTQENIWTPLARTGDIPLNEGRAISIGGREVAVFHLDNCFLTIDNRCPHKGGPLCDGIVAGAVVVCPLHGRRFDLETGAAVRVSEAVCVATYATRVEAGVVLADLNNARRVMD